MWEWYDSKKQWKYNSLREQLRVRMPWESEKALVPVNSGVRMPWESEKAFVRVNRGVWECGDRARQQKWDHKRDQRRARLHMRAEEAKTRSYDCTAACMNAEKERKCDRMRERRRGGMLRGWKSWENAIGCENSGVCERWEKAKSEKCFLIDRKSVV